MGNRRQWAGSEPPEGKEHPAMPPATSVALTVISAAVTPIVMISAAAALILGLNQKHNSLSERLRQLMAEFRTPQTTAERRANIWEQVILFRLRFRYVD